MTWRPLYFVFGLAGLALAITPVDKCYKEIISNTNGIADCNSFVVETVTATTPTLTVTLTASPTAVHVAQTDTAYSSTQTTDVIETTVTSTFYIKTTPIEEDVTTQTLSADATKVDYQTTTFTTFTITAYKNKDRREDSPPPRHTIPAYASDCLNDAQYSKQCLGAGATVSFTTYEPPLATTTTQITPTVLYTDQTTVTDAATGTVTTLETTTETVGRVTFVSTKTFWLTLPTTVMDYIDTITSSTLTETKTTMM